MTSLFIFNQKFKCIGKIGIFRYSIVQYRALIRDAIIRDKLFKKKLLGTNKGQILRKKFSIKQVADFFILTDCFSGKAHFTDRFKKEHLPLNFHSCFFK